MPPALMMIVAYVGHEMTENWLGWAGLVPGLIKLIELPPIISIGTRTSQVVNLR